MIIKGTKGWTTVLDWEGNNIVWKYRSLWFCGFHFSHHAWRFYLHTQKFEPLLYSIINSTIEKYRSDTFIWMVTLVRISSTDSNLSDLPPPPPLQVETQSPPPHSPQHAHTLDATQCELCSIHASCQMTCLPQFSLYVVTRYVHLMLCLGRG